MKKFSKSTLVAISTLILLVIAYLFFGILSEKRARAGEDYGECTTRLIGHRTFYIAIHAVDSPIYNKLVRFNADYKTLETLSLGYCKDKNYVYYWGKIVENVNPSTFELPVDALERFN